MDVIIAIGILVAVLWAVIEFTIFIVDDHSLTVRVVRYTKKLLVSLFTFHQKKNKILICSYCKKLSREYQRRIYQTIHEEERCPHCQKPVFRDHIYNEIEKEEKWMNFHPDCPKINIVQHLKLKHTMKKVKKNQEDEKSQKFYEEYNDIKADFNWIENLYKKQN